MADALVGGAFLSAFLQVLFDRMASPQFLNFICGRKPSEQLLRRLKITLLSVNAVLNDAEEKQITNPSVKGWLDELKDAVYQAEDLVDEISTEATKFMLESEFGRGNRNQVKDLSFTCLGAFQRKIEKKLEEILESLTYIVNQKGVLGLKEGVGMKPSPRLPTTCLVDESGVYGRDGDKEEIIESLISDDAEGRNLGVVTIIGMGGIGKTTLAQIVYSDERVEGLFDLRAWVCVSEEFDVFKITKTILEAVTLQVCDVKDLNLLQLKLNENLSGRKFLIVLDDVWNESYMNWEFLRNPFKSGAPGSRIIVTTRNESVASIMRSTIPPHRLKQLTDKDCWLLFARHAFESIDAATRSNLEEMGRVIVRKCKGLPLAAKTLGGLLRSKLNPEEWKEVLESDVWDLSDEASGILPALRLSYHYLPSHLKRCFAYCSIFPKDYEFENEQIVKLWMAEDFLQHPKRNKRMEDIGDEYFNELLSRSLFQLSSSKRSCFVMHDLVHDLAQYVSREFCFTLEDERTHAISEKARHFSYVKGKYDVWNKFEALYKAEHLRTFLPLTLHERHGYLANAVLHELLPTRRCLRVLSLSHYSNITELPNSIGNLKHLRYLNASHTGIKCLPNSITALCNLQTLLLSNCRSLVKLPDDMMKLISLRHLDIRKTSLKEMPLQISRLKSLQTLSTFIVGKHSGPGITELRELVHLRGALTILELQNVVPAGDAAQANLKERKYLVDLEMQGCADTNDSQHDREVLNKLQPHTNLRKLTLNNYGGTKFPNWLGDPSFFNLVYLYLSNCKYCLALPPLGLFPTLKFLYVIAVDAVEVIGPEFYGTCSPVAPFRSLEFLEFRDMLEWREWCSSGREGLDFPLLKQLLIKNCPKLIGSLPDHLLSLNKLVVSGCQQLVAEVPRAQALHEVMLFDCNKLLLAKQNFDSQPVCMTEISNVISPPRPKLKELPPGLRKLTISGCDSLDSIPESAIFSNPSLQELNVYNCSSLVSLPKDCLATSIRVLRIQKCRTLELPLDQPYASLEILSIKCSCDSLRTLPLDFFPKLISLNIWRCRHLESLSVSENSNQMNLEFLQSLQIRSCPSFMLFPGGLSAPNLTRFLVASCKKFKLLPETMYTSLPSLQNLQIAGCPQFVSFPEGGLPSNVNSLSISSCKRFIPLVDFGFQRLPFLTKLTIEGCKDIESFPEDLLLPSSLTCLRIFGLSNLKVFNSKGLRALVSLERLEIDNCPMLESMPEEGLPSSLSMLVVTRCPSLNQRCQRGNGGDWRSIAHIPFIEIDGKFI